MFALDDLPALGLFARVVQSQSFAEAARREGLTKSAVSQRIARLEERLGTQLLKRSTRKLSLTDDGLRLYEHAASLLSVSEAATHCVHLARARGKEVSGIVRVNAPASFPRRRVMAALSTFVASYPDVRVQLTLDDSLIDLIDARFDVVLRVTPADDQTFVARKLDKDRVLVVGSRAYFAKLGKPTHPEDLLRHRCLHNTRFAIRDEWRFGSDKRRYGIPIEPVFESNDSASLSEAALAGIGLMYGPSLLVADDVLAGRLESVLEPHLKQVLGVYAIAPARKFKTPSVRALTDHLARYFARHPLGIGDSP